MFNATAMFSGLYALSITYMATGGDWAYLIEFLKDLNLGPLFWAPFKALAAFPLTYHCLNGVRHMVSLSCHCLYDNSVTGKSCLTYGKSPLSY